MRFYTHSHPYYCGIDLHARSLYVCILDEQDEIVLHKDIPANPDALLKALKPYIGNVIVGVECMHCWYWVADWCDVHGVDFVLGHALYMKAIYQAKSKNDRIDSFKIAKLLKGGNFPLAYRYPTAMRATRDLMRRRTHIVRYGGQLKAHVKNTAAQYNLPQTNLDLNYARSRDEYHRFFPDPSVQRSVDMDLYLVGCFNQELAKVERFILQQAKQHNTRDLYLLKSIKGVGDVLALTILYEIGEIKRFESVQQFASYARLITCKAESAGKVYGIHGKKIGNAHLKWAFSEAAALYLQGNDKGKQYLKKLERRMPKRKALSVLAHKLGRCVYYMLKQQKVFDGERFLTV